tara:strand:- start:262 stop:453 length:192 start_codon:yes stop_codon:yes gene_type:complete
MSIKITVEIEGGVLNFVYASGDTPEEKHLAETTEVTLLDHDVMEEEERLKLEEFANEKQVCIY